MMKKLFLISILSLACAGIVSADDLLHVKRFLGFAEVAPETMDVRNAYYWSVGTQVDGTGYIRSASQEFSCGISQADYRICTYEDGSPIFEDGKYFFNMSSRSAGVMEGVYAFDINTCNFTFIGVLQGYKEGKPFQFVAPHIIYNRHDGMWYVFAHWENPHHLCVGKCYRDPRYGYNEVHAELLDYEGRVKGDEDNFVYYDSTIRRWVLVYSKKASMMSKQVSKRIDGGYKLVCSQDEVKTLTGINVIKVGGKRYIVTGSMWKPEEDAYKVFNADDLSYLYDLNLDIPTGGFRGWGTVIGITEGLETKYQLITFDRANPSPVNRWQYGNMYSYEAVERNPGTEFDLVRPDGKVIKANAVEKYTPKDLHFRRKFSQRMNYSQSFQTGRLDLSSRLFIKNGDIYSIKDNEGQVTYSQKGASLCVEGKGCVSLLGGTHLPNAEYVIDLSEMSPNEVRYLKIGTMDKDVLDLRFAAAGDETVISSGAKEILRIDSDVTKLRVIIKDTIAYFVDADK